MSSKPYTDDDLADVRDWPGGSALDNERRGWLATLDAERAAREEAEHGWAEARVIITGQAGRLRVLEADAEAAEAEVERLNSVVLVNLQEKVEDAERRAGVGWARAEAAAAENARLREYLSQLRAYYLHGGGDPGLMDRIDAALAEQPTPAACPTCGSENPEKRRSKQYPRHTEYCPDPFHTPPAACETCGGDGEVDESETGFPIYKRMSPCPDCTPPAEAEPDEAAQDPEPHKFLRASHHSMTRPWCGVCGRDEHSVLHLDYRPAETPPAEAEFKEPLYPPYPDAEYVDSDEPPEAAPRQEAQEQDGPCQHDWHEEATSWRCPACNEGPEEAAQEGGERDALALLGCECREAFFDEVHNRMDAIEVDTSDPKCTHIDSLAAADSIVDWVLSELQARAAQEQEGGDPVKRRIDAQREEGRFASLDPWDWAIDALNDYECSAGIEAEDRDELRSILHRMFRDYGQARAGQGRKMPTVEEVGDVIRRCVFCTWDPLEGTASAARAVLRLFGEE